MTLELIEDAGGDLRNARTLAVACDLAYLPEAQGVEAFRTQLGLEVKLISRGNTQAYVGVNADHVVIAFRGTEAPNSIEGLKDWLLTDAVNLLIVPEGRLGTDLAAAGVGALFHQGFINALADIWEPVFTVVEAELKTSERPLWITGHSLGGALAKLAAWVFQRKMLAVHQIYTFGAPMIGNEQAAQAFDREFAGKVFRYVNGPDPIPMLPTVSLIANKYLHSGKEMLLGATGSGSLLQQLAGSPGESVLIAALIDNLWKGLQQIVGAHAMDNYRARLKE